MVAQKKPFVIINADDFNLTAGISRGIVSLFKQGVLSSTSVFVTGSCNHSIEQLRSLQNNGIGLHFNITLGKPLSNPRNIKTLVTRKGTFIPLRKRFCNRIVQSDVKYELEAQLDRFTRLFGRMPSHIDTHHHVHFFKDVFEVLREIAVRHTIPLRRRFINQKTGREKNIITTDYIHVRFNPVQPWTIRTLINTLQKLKKGTHEIVVHPGFVDKRLTLVSSFSHAREIERCALASAQFKEALTRTGVCMIQYDRLKQLHGIDNDITY